MPRRLRNRLLNKKPIQLKPSVKSLARRPKRRKPGRGFLWVRGLLLLVGCMGLVMLTWYLGNVRLERIYNRTLKGLMSAGLTLESVVVEPTIYVSSKNILERMQVYRGQLLFTIDPEKVRETVEALPWVASAVVRRCFPDTLYIRVVERHPAAIWNFQDKVCLVDKTGCVLMKLGRKIPEAFSHLPSIAGQGAAEKAPQLFEQLAPYADIKAQLKMAICVGKRRWNLLLNNQVLVMLPEDDLPHALGIVQELFLEHALDSQVLKHVDLRVIDKMIFKLTPEATVKLRAKGTAKET